MTRVPTPLLAIALALALGACRAHSAAPPEGTAAPATSAAPAGSSPALPRGLVHAGMAYGAFRKAVLDRGWTPLPDARCLAHVVGGNAATLCAAHLELASCHACAQVPELSACSGDGYCQMRFRRDRSHDVLRASTFGPVHDWNAPADRSRLRITHWQIVPATP